MCAEPTPCCDVDDEVDDDDEVASGRRGEANPFISCQTSKPTLTKKFECTLVIKLISESSICDNRVMLRWKSPRGDTEGAEVIAAGLKQKKNEIVF